MPSSFQISYGITASATPAIETKRLVVSWDVNNNKADVVKYKSQSGSSGNIYTKQEGTLNLEEFQSLYRMIVSRIWSLPSITEEGVDLYGEPTYMYIKIFYLRDHATLAHHHVAVSLRQGTMLACS